MGAFDAQTEFYDQVFEAIDLRGGTVVDKEFHDCVFVGAQLAETAFVRCKFVGCKFQSCDLSNATFKSCALREPTFEESKLVGVNWTTLAASSRLSFVACVLNYANFNGCDLRKARFERCIARETEFGAANLTDADCRGTDFAGSRFSNSNLSKADLRGALNYAIRPADNTLRQAKFSLPEATSLLHGLDIILED